MFRIDNRCLSKVSEVSNFRKLLFFEKVPFRLMLLLVLIGFSSCRVMFTEGVRNKLDMQGIDLNRVQFYNSEKIILKRTLTKSEATLASGKVTFQNGEFVEITQIKRKTPGICDSIGDHALYIRFESGANKGLKFSNNQVADSSSTYQMATENMLNKKKKVEIIDGFGEKKMVDMDLHILTVNYDGKEYQVAYDKKPELMIKKKQINKRKIFKRTASGMKVK